MKLFEPSIARMRADFDVTLQRDYCSCTAEAASGMNGWDAKLQGYVIAREDIEVR